MAAASAGEAPIGAAGPMASGGYPYSAWMPGYRAQVCTPDYCEQAWAPGYYRRW
ncbi:MAG: hypothetical protein ABSB94_20265 [Syntrophorhabdales bacterium]